MDESRFNTLVARLERESRDAPGRYKFRVALLALLGFLLLMLILGISGSGILLLAGIAIFALVSGAKALLLVIKLGKILLLLAAPLWMLLRSSLSALLTRLPAPVGREITRSEAPALFAAMDEMRQKMRGPRFHHVFVTADMNAAVVQRPLFGLIGFPRNYLILGLPLLESLAPEEALAVIAHEYGHLSGAHAHFGAFIYRLRITWGTIQSVADRWTGFAGSTLRRVIAWYAPFFNAYSFVLARANEYTADAASAELVGASVAANALKRVNIADVRYQQFLGDVFAQIRDCAEPPHDTAARWSCTAGLEPPQAQATRWLEDSLKRRRSAFDTHPVLLARLEALPGQSGRAATLPAALNGPSAASRWLGESVIALREWQQQEWIAQVKDRWAEGHTEWQTRRQRLAELRAMQSLTLAQDVERLRLQVQMDTQVDHLPELVAFNQRHADCAPSVYLEGDVRLKSDDRTGLQCLDRAMELDGDAVKPACELAFEFLMRRGESERAASYRTRWLDRNAWENQRACEFEKLDPAHELVSAGIDPETEQRIRDLLETHEDSIAQAWLARRVLPSDASIHTYVLGLKLTAWSRLRRQGPKIVNELVRREWPIHLFVCTLDHNKIIARKLLGVPGARIFSRKG